MGLPIVLNVDAPLPEELRLYVMQHGPTLMRALVNEIATVTSKLRDAEREVATLRARLRDSRGTVND